MPSLTSQLILSLVDNLSGPARQAAQNLGQTAKAIEQAGKGIKAAQWGTAFQQELNKLKLSTRELDAVRRSWEGFQRSIREGGRRPTFGTYLPALDAWKTRTISNLQAVRGEYEKLGGVGSRVGRMLANVGAMVGGAYAGQRAIRATAEQGAILQREGARNYLAGMTPAESVKAQAYAAELSRKYPSLDQSQIMERLRNLRSFGGSLEKAFQMADDHMKGLVVLQSIKGKAQAMSEMQRFTKGLDIIGRNESAADVSALLNSYVKALGVDSDLNMGDFAMMARYAKSGGVALSNEFLGAIAPTFLQDIGGQRFGTMLGSEISQLIAGRGTKESKAYQARVGLRDRSGAVVGRDLLMTNPYEWAQQYIPDAMRREKLDPAKDMDVVQFTSKLFSNQMVSDLFAKFITQREQAERNKRLYAGAPGLEAAEQLKAKDPFVAWEGFMASVRNFLANVAEPLMEPAAKGLNALAGGIANLTKAVSDNPLASYGITGTAAVAGGAAGLWATAKAVRFWRLLTGAGGVAGGALAGEVGGAGAAAAGGGLGSWLGPLGLPLAWFMTRRPDIVTSPALKQRWEAITGQSWKRANAWRADDYTFGSRGTFAPYGTALPPGGFRRVPESYGARFGDTPMGQYPLIGYGGLEGLFAMAPKAGAAGQQTGQAFRESMSSEMQKALEEINAFVSQAIQKMSFTASPTIAPKFAPAPADSGSQETRRAGIRTAYNDYGIGELA